MRTTRLHRRPGAHWQMRLEIEGWQKLEIKLKTRFEQIVRLHEAGEAARTMNTLSLDFSLRHVCDLRALWRENVSTSVG
jgi:hypothetical protein